MSKETDGRRPLVALIDKTDEVKAYLSDDGVVVAQIAENTYIGFSLECALKLSEHLAKAVRHKIALHKLDPNPFAALYYDPEKGPGEDHS